MGRVGFLELVIIFCGMLLIFGPKQLPKLTSAIRQSIKQIKKDVQKDDTIETKEEPERTECN